VQEGEENTGVSKTSILEDNKSKVQEIPRMYQETFGSQRKFNVITNVCKEL
jgi:hypothetical protein